MQEPSGACLLVHPIHDSDGNRIGSRVFDSNGNELDEDDPEFRRAVLGGHGDSSAIVGGDVIFKRAVPVAHAPISAVDADAIARARAKISAMRDRT
jgi:hypothetical protein